jgi:hypothetical protein
MMKRLAAMVLLALLGAGIGGCQSHIAPLRPLEKVQVWVPDMSAATTPATSAAPATTAVSASQPGHMESRTVDPNQTTRYVYDANYDTVWKQAQNILAQSGFAIDRQDYRLGEITTLTLPSAQIVEFWKPQQANGVDALENTVNNQRRWVRLTISPVEGKPKFMVIGLRVLVERETNPSEHIGGPVFVEGSGFGRNAVTLRSDYAPPRDVPGIWYTVGHDPDLEKKLLDALFARI